MSILTRFNEASVARLIPLQVTLELTYRCNERCGHCYLATYDDKEDGRPPLRLDEWRRILDQLAQAGTLLIVLIGGEAMMHPQFWGVAEHAVSNNFALDLITNGLLIDEAAADRIADLGFLNITISLYSQNAETHDRMTRKKGSHAKTMAAIARLRERGVGVGLNCLLTGSNIDTCFELDEWAVAHGLRVRFDPMVTAKIDSSLASTETRATHEQLHRYYSRLKQRGRGPVPSLERLAEDPVCNAGRGKAAVNPYGDLLTCLEVREPIGNLRDQSFQQLWHSAQAEKLRGYATRDIKFDTTCGDGKFCEHCPGMAGAETGDRMTPVPFLMTLAQIKRQVFEDDSV